MSDLVPELPAEHDPHIIARFNEMLEKGLKDRDIPHWFMVTAAPVPVGQRPNAMGELEPVIMAGVAIFVMRRSLVPGDSLLTTVDYIVDIMDMLEPEHFDKWLAGTIFKLAGGASERLQKAMREGTNGFQG